MKDLLLLCSKNVRFSYDNKLYSQEDGVVMESPLGPVIAHFYVRIGKECDTKVINTYD